MANESTVVAPHHHALLVGIDAYAESPLAGAVQDIDEIEQYLKQAIDPLDVHLQTLVAPQQARLDGSGSHENARRRPTCRTVTAALRDILMRARAGHYVYIHFSGHGTKVMDKDDDEDDDAGDKYSDQFTGDLALVLLGEEDNTPALLLGPTLGRHFLNPMVKKGLIVTLVLDCCFSASVYRRDDNIRCLPYKTPGVTFRLYSHEAEETQEVGTTLRGTRDASMRQNWLMDPSGYAILTACAAGQESGEFRINGVSHGKLSYFLRQSFNRAGGCRKTHAAIYRHLHTVFRAYHRGQDPVLYGRKDQAFFGDVDTESSHLLEVVKDRAGKLQLQAGRAHGLCTGDRLLLHSVNHVATSVIAKIVQLGDLSSIVEPTDETTGNQLSMSTSTSTSPSTWAASILTQSSLRAYPVHLRHDLPHRTQLQAALMERSLTIEDNKSAPHAFHVTSATDQDLEIQNERGGFLATTTYTEAAEQIEHLVRFALVKDLMNPDSEETFQKCFSVYIKNGANRFDSDATIAAQHGESFSLVLENCGPTSLFFSAYGLLSDWQVENLFDASYLEVAAPDSTRTHIRHSRKVTMTVPDAMLEKGLQKCDDYLKIFVTSQPSLFDSLELPALGQAVPTKRRRESDVFRTPSTPEQSEQWASMMFHITVST